MKAALLREARRVEVAVLPVPAVESGMVRIRVGAVGLCGTDVQVWAGLLPVKLPVVLGHELAGTVEEVAADVTTVRPGDRVIAEGSWPCGECTACLRGEPHRCEDRRMLGRTVHGAFAEWVVVPAPYVHRIPAPVDDVTAQSAVTVATAVRACRRLGDVRGKHVCVIGPGHAGLLLQQVLKDAGAQSVIVMGTSIDAGRLRKASALGATGVVEIGRENPIEATRAWAPSGFDVVVEAAGAPPALRLALDLVATGGKVLVFGIAKAPVDGFQASLLYQKELTLLGSRGAAGCYDDALALLARDAVKVAPLVSHELPLAKVEEAFRIWETRADDALRVVLRPW